MKTDAQLMKDVSTELELDASIDARHLGVSVRDGVVTLTGYLNSCAAKIAVEKIIQRVEGVRAIAVELEVKLQPADKRSDADIVAAAEMVFKWHTLIPADRIQIKVEEGWVTLTGNVEWDYQRQHAEKIVRMLTGVLGVTNIISLNGSTTPANVANRIRDTLARHAEEEAKNIEVIVKGATVTLRGTVNSWIERTAVYSAAWSAPGVSNVINEIKVQA